MSTKKCLIRVVDEGRIFVVVFEKEEKFEELRKFCDYATFLERAVKTKGSVDKEKATSDQSNSDGKEISIVKTKPNFAMYNQNEADVIKKLENAQSSSKSDSVPTAPKAVTPFTLNSHDCTFVAEIGDYAHAYGYRFTSSIIGDIEASRPQEINSISHPVFTCYALRGSGISMMLTPTLIGLWTDGGMFSVSSKDGPFNKVFTRGSCFNYRCADFAQFKSEKVLVLDRSLAVPPELGCLSCFKLKRVNVTCDACRKMYESVAIRKFRRNTALSRPANLGSMDDNCALPAKQNNRTSQNRASNQQKGPKNPPGRSGHENRRDPQNTGDRRNNTGGGPHDSGYHPRNQRRQRVQDNPRSSSSGANGKPPNEIGKVVFPSQEK